MTKDGNKKILYIILSIALIVVVAVGTFFTIKIIGNINANNSSEGDSINNNDNIKDIDNHSSDGDYENITPTLEVENDIQFDKLTIHKFHYTVKNLGEYSVKICIEDDSIASIDNDLNITPMQIGTTRIITSINSEPQIIKYTTLTIVDTITDVCFDILNKDETPANVIYAYNTYYLKITKNTKVEEDFKIGYDDIYIENLSLISKSENYIKYSFRVVKSGEFNFKFISKNCSKISDNITSYNYPNNFEVSFNIPVINNSINLYLFNNNYKTEANDDGLYDVASFNISTINNSNDSILVSINNDCVILNNNQIFANKEGTSTITFKSNISNVTKTYKLIISKILPTAVIFNGTQKEIYDSLMINLEINAKKDFYISIIPSYYYGNYTIEKDDGIIIENNNIQITENKDKNVLIRYNNNTILTITIKYCPSFKISKNIYNCSTEYTFVNDILTVNFEEDLEIFIFVEILDQNNTPNKDQTLLFTISNTNVAISSNSSSMSINNTIRLNILDVGTTTITIYNNDLNISTTITINVS